MAIGKPNIADILRGYLEDRVKDKLITDITDDLVKEYRRKVKEVVSSELESITFGEIEHVKDMLEMAEYLNVDIKVRYED